MLSKNVILIASTPPLDLPFKRFGHQDKISSVAALHKETCLTPGSRDRTVRLWKIVEESQLIFRSGGSGELDEAMDSVNSNNPQEKKKRADTGGSVDCVTMIDEETFLSGSDNG